MAKGNLFITGEVSKPKKNGSKSKKAKSSGKKKVNKTKAVQAPKNNSRGNRGGASKTSEQKIKTKPNSGTTSLLNSIIPQSRTISKSKQFKNVIKQKAVKIRKFFKNLSNLIEEYSNDNAIDKITDEITDEITDNDGQVTEPTNHA